MSAWGKARRWLARHGLAAGVLVAAAGAAVLALAVPGPDELPSLAQGSVALWRLEQFIFSFAAFYLPLMVFALALRGRGFVEFGPGGVKAGDVAQQKQQIGLQELAAAMEVLRQSIEKNAALTQVAVEQTRVELEELRQRLDELDDAS